MIHHFPSDILGRESKNNIPTLASGKRRNPITRDEVFRQAGKLMADGLPYQEAIAQAIDMVLRSRSLKNTSPKKTRWLTVG